MISILDKEPSRDRTFLQGLFIAQPSAVQMSQRRCVYCMSDLCLSHTTSIGPSWSSKGLQNSLLPCTCYHRPDVDGQLNAGVPGYLAQLSKDLKFKLVYISTGKLDRCLYVSHPLKVFPQIMCLTERRRRMDRPHKPTLCNYMANQNETER